MKFLALALATIIAVAAAVDSRLVGRFCHASLHASLCLDLKADGSYEESFRDGNEYVLGQKPKEEPREGGRWQVSEDKLVLLPPEGKKRILSVTKRESKIVLIEYRDGKAIHEYRN